LGVRGGRLERSTRERRGERGERGKQEGREEWVEGGKGERRGPRRLHTVTKLSRTRTVEPLVLLARVRATISVDGVAVIALLSRVKDTIGATY
jgi:hypothetical protein